MQRDIKLLSRNLFLYGFRFFCTMFMAVVTATLFLRTNLHPDNVESGNLYFSVLFFSLIMLMCAATPHVSGLKVIRLALSCLRVTYVLGEIDRLALAFAGKRLS